MCRGKKKTYTTDGDQRQISSNTTTMLSNVLKACAEEYLNINKDEYDKEIENKDLEVFLLDGKAMVKDPSFTYHRTSFSFVYIKVDG